MTRALPSDADEDYRQRAEEAVENLRHLVRSNPSDGPSDEAFGRRGAAVHFVSWPTEDHTRRRANDAAEYLRQQLRDRGNRQSVEDQASLRAHSAADYLRQQLATQPERNTLGVVAGAAKILKADEPREGQGTR
jgi:hypothetical protein